MSYMEFDRQPPEKWAAEPWAASRAYGTPFYYPIDSFMIFYISRPTLILCIAKLLLCYYKSIKKFFGFARYRNVTHMLLYLGPNGSPGFHIVLISQRASLSPRISSTPNNLVQHSCSIRHYLAFFRFSCFLVSRVARTVLSIWSCDMLLY